MRNKAQENTAVLIPTWPDVALSGGALCFFVHFPSPTNASV